MELQLFENKQIRNLLLKNSVSMLGVFGSIARGEETKDSDIDLLVEFSGTQGLLTVIKLERELEKILGRKIDLVTKKSISPYLRKIILKDLKIIYESTAKDFYIKDILLG